MNQQGSSKHMFRIGFVVGFAVSMVTAFQNCTTSAPKLEQTSNASQTPSCHLKSVASSSELPASAVAEKYSEAQSSLAKETSGTGRFEALATYVNAAINSSHLEDGDRAARDIIHESSAVKDASDPGYAIHEAHILLGRLALKKNDLPLAREHLREASLVDSSPRLKTLGPNMSLAKELLERGDCPDVLVYLQTTTKFWNDDTAKKASAEWMSNIASGQMPDFKGNLYY